MNQKNEVMEIAGSQGKKRTEPWGAAEEDPQTP